MVLSREKRQSPLTDSNRRPLPYHERADADVYGPFAGFCRDTGLLAAGMRVDAGAIRAAEASIRLP